MKIFRQLDTTHLEYEIPDEIKNIEFHYDESSKVWTKKFGEFVNRMKLARLNGENYGTAFSSLIHFEEAADLHKIQQSSIEDIQLQPHSHRIFKIEYCRKSPHLYSFLKDCL